ncbi:HAD family hydrolase [Bradyrhizobium sp. HKCCYLS1011]|uniref:HAD family hydrolase n=1 Tax=Bradyrhizobium sp. HKCCYLS1011 TaxID=3420733 RepID=UPI003EC08853
MRTFEPELIIFDCDGVLVDSELLSCQSLADGLAVAGIALSLDEALKLFLGRSTKAVLEHYRSLGRELPESFLADLKQRVRDSFSASLQPIPGIAALLSTLTVPCCVASSSDLDRIKFSLQFTGLIDHFGDRLYSAEMVARGKPAPDLFLLAADRMGIPPARTLVVEDSVSGVMAAKAAGMTAWGFTGGSHYHGRDGHGILQAAGADRVFDCMRDFSGDL